MLFSRVLKYVFILLMFMMKWFLKRIKKFLTIRQVRGCEYTCECGDKFRGKNIEKFFDHQIKYEHWYFTKNNLTKK